jgi:predicted DNA-binding transcriptional regulator YafY
MNRIDRLTAILIHLQSKRVVKAEEMASRFEISLRTIYRDVRALMEAGVPIGSEAGKGYFIVDGYHLPPVMFSQEEANAILMANKLVEKMTDHSIRKAFESALIKIKSVLPEGEKDNLERLESFVEVHPLSRPPSLFENHFLNDIQKALVAREVLEMEYYSNNDELTKREVEPVGILYYSASWHLIAWCRIRNDYRDFRADRIKSLVHTHRKSERKLMSIQEYLKSYARLHEGLEKVTVVFDKALFKHRSYVYGFISEEDLGDRVRFTFVADHMDWIARWLLSFGPSVEIEQPLHLKSKVIDLVEQLQTHYLIPSEQEKS